MKSNGFLKWLAVIPLIVLSCSKADIVSEEAVDPVKEKDPWALEEASSVAYVSGDKSLTASYDEETKSQISLNPGGTSASVVWSAGDSFIMMRFGGGYRYATVYTTEEGGPSATFTGGGSLSGSSSYSSLYPEAAINTGMLNSETGKPLLCVKIPHEQTATPNGVSAGANLSFCMTETQDEHKVFKNIVSLVKFKLSGSVVSQVHSVTLHGVSPLAGDFVITADEIGDPVLVTDLYFPAYNTKYRSVTLTGSFTAGVDYYIAVAPSSQDSFSMTFANSDNSKHTTKVSEKIMTLDRSRIKDLGTIALGDSFTGDPAGGYTPIAYNTHTKGTKAVTLVVIPEGYTAEQLDTYEAEATAALNALFNTHPYKAYKDYFNVWILKVASNESGASVTDGHGNITTKRDCYFRSKWGPDYKDMAANADKVYSFVEDNCPDIKDGTHTIDDVSIAMIINESRYGGICHISDTGRSYAMIPNDPTVRTWYYPTTEAYSATATPGNTRTVSSSEIETEGLRNTGIWYCTFVHEFGGHGFGRLLDEYWYNTTYSAPNAVAEHTWDLPYGLNVSGDYATTPWDALLDVKEEWAASDSKYNRIGRYQGGEVSMFYRWRSERISCMIDNRFYYSTWQRYLIAKRIISLSGGGTLSLADFKAKDDPTDPVRDGGGSLAPKPIGTITMGPEHISPMLPPPVFHTDW